MASSDRTTVGVWCAEAVGKQQLAQLPQIIRSPAPALMTLVQNQGTNRLTGVRL